MAGRSASVRRQAPLPASSSATRIPDLNRLLAPGEFGQLTVLSAATDLPPYVAAAFVTPDRPQVGRALLLAALSSPRLQGPKPAGPAPDAKVSNARSIEAKGADIVRQDLSDDAVAQPPRSAATALDRQLAFVVPAPMARPLQPSVDERQPFRRRNPAPAGLLAYARPDAGALGGERSIIERPVDAAPALRAGTAVYDIAAATVYLPNGERLEAHSGLGAMRDNARYVKERMRGPTPVHTYDLTLRESLFHGVAAIRLNPVGGAGNVHNRVGLLAHTYMLGPRGDSNGCVSIKDYKRFLAAFQRGDIRRLVVVASGQSPVSRFTSLFRWAK